MVGLWNNSINNKAGIAEKSNGKSSWEFRNIPKRWNAGFLIFLKVKIGGILKVNRFSLFDILEVFRVGFLKNICLLHIWTRKGGIWFAILSLLVCYHGLCYPVLFCSHLVRAESRMNTGFLARKALVQMGFLKTGSNRHFCQFWREIRREGNTSKPYTAGRTSEPANLFLRCSKWRIYQSIGTASPMWWTRISFTGSATSASPLPCICSEYFRTIVRKSKWHIYLLNEFSRREQVRRNKKTGGGSWWRILLKNCFTVTSTHRLGDTARLKYDCIEY